MNRQHLRQLFNEGGYLDRLQRGELFALPARPPHPASPDKGQVPGTMSEQLVYFDRKLNRVAVVHQYLRPDGTLGGSGRPDPYRLYLADEILYAH